MHEVKSHKDEEKENERSKRRRGERIQLKESWKQLFDILKILPTPFHWKSCYWNHTLAHFHCIRFENTLFVWVKSGMCIEKYPLQGKKRTEYQLKNIRREWKQYEKGKGNYYLLVNGNGWFGIDNFCFSNGNQCENEWNNRNHIFKCNKMHKFSHNKMTTPKQRKEIDSGFMLHLLYISSEVLFCWIFRKMQSRDHKMSKLSLCISI